MNIKISIIIPTYNASKVINRCLDSVFSQQFNGEMEIICIDDGSIDNTIDVIKLRKEKNILIYRQSNNGPASARNKGIMTATGKYIAFLDADDYWEPMFLEETSKFLENHGKKCIAVSVAQKHITVSGIGVYPNFINEKKLHSDMIIDDFFSFWSKHRHICTGSVLVLAEVAKRIGGQREDLRICEDLEFWAYISTFGKWGFIPKILFISDGIQQTKEIGWLKKNRSRWESAPSFDVLCRRLKEKRDFSFSDEYMAWIIPILIYSMVLSGKIELAKDEFEKYRGIINAGKMDKLYRICSINIVTWKFLCIFLKLREQFRKI